MKRFFYGMIAASLLLTGGCSKDKSGADEDMSVDAMSADELAAAEEEAVRELAKIIAQEAADMPVADADFDGFPEDMNFEDLSPEEQEQLNLWEAEARAWAEEEMQFAMAEAQEAGLEAIQFSGESADLGEAQQQVLDKDVEVVRGLIEQGRDVIVQGHVNGSEDADRNLELSESRANAVRDALINAGLDGDHIEAVAYADSLPLELGSSEANDRVDLALA
jgi:outer membrane protein OmpA-like peptidoglycan-associated protein